MNILLFQTLFMFKNKYVQIYIHLSFLETKVGSICCVKTKSFTPENRNMKTSKIDRY